LELDGDCSIPKSFDTPPKYWCEQIIEPGYPADHSVMDNGEARC